MARRQFSDVNVNFPLHPRHFPSISATLHGNSLKYRRWAPLKSMLGHHLIQKEQAESMSTWKIFYLFKFSKIPLRPVTDKKDRTIDSIWQIVKLKPRLHLAAKISWIVSKTAHYYKLCLMLIISFKQDLASSTSEYLNLFLWCIILTISSVPVFHDNRISGRLLHV